MNTNINPVVKLKDIICLFQSRVNLYVGQMYLKSIDPNTVISKLLNKESVFEKEVEYVEHENCYGINIILKEYDGSEKNYTNSELLEEALLMLDISRNDLEEAIILNERCE